MPAPVALAPIALKFAQYGAVAALVFWAARRKRPAGPREMWRETALGDVDEGLETAATRDGDETRLDAAGRWRRVFRAGGQGLEIDAAGLARLRLRRTRS